MGLQQYTAREYYEDGIGSGQYQFTPLNQVITNFEIAYVGEGKVIPKVKRTDIAFHAQRALAELSFDVLRSCKAEEFEVPPSLQKLLPIDYVNYTQVSWVDSAGIKHRIYPENKSSNPSIHRYQDEDGKYSISMQVKLTQGSNIFELTGDWRSQIIVGMRFGSHSYIATQSYAHEISYNATTDITSVTVKNSDGTVDRPAGVGTGVNSIPLNPFTSANDAVVELTIQRHNVLGIQRATDNTYVETTVAAAPNVGDNIIIVSDTSEIKAGMLVSHPGFPNSPGTGPAAKVINVGTYHVEFDTTITNPVANGSTIGFLKIGDPDSTTWENYKSSNLSENTINDYQDYQNDIYWPNEGKRFGLDPQRAQVNGYFYICGASKIHFSSNLAGRTIVFDYISDSLANDGEMQVPKLAEEALYKSIIYAILSTRANVQEYVVRRFKKEKFAAVRNAKIRISNTKLEEITQVLRGKSKQIKH
jgi:hypothetical protein